MGRIGFRVVPDIRVAPALQEIPSGGATPEKASDIRRNGTDIVWKTGRFRQTIVADLR